MPDISSAPGRGGDGGSDRDDVEREAAPPAPTMVEDGPSPEEEGETIGTVLEKREYGVGAPSPHINVNGKQVCTGRCRRCALGTTRNTSVAGRGLYVVTQNRSCIARSLTSFHMCCFVHIMPGPQGDSADNTYKPAPPNRVKGRSSTCTGILLSTTRFSQLSDRRRRHRETRPSSRRSFRRACKPSARLRCQRACDFVCLFSVKIAGHSQAGVGPTAKGRLMMMRASGGTAGGWKWDGKKLYDHDYTLPAIFVANLNPKMDAERSTFVFDLDELVAIKGIVVGKTDLMSAWEKLPRVRNYPWPLF